MIKLILHSLSHSQPGICFLFFSFSITKIGATASKLSTWSSWKTLSDTMEKAEPAIEALTDDSGESSGSRKEPCRES